jgi:hypothetical protein
VFHKTVTTNKNYFPVQHYLAGLSNDRAVCSLGIQSKSVYIVRINIKLQRLNNATYDISTILKEAVTERFKPQSQTLHADELTKVVRIMDKICSKAE